MVDYRREDQRTTVALLHVILDFIGVGREAGDGPLRVPLQTKSVRVSAPSIPLPTKTKSTHDVMPPLRVAIVDLDVARLRGVRDVGDVDGLPAGRDLVRDRIRRDRRSVVLVLDAATDADPVEVEADVYARGRALRDFGRAAEGVLDVFGGAAAAVSCCIW